MQVNIAGICRNIKNLSYNYSDAQVKVREATSNDPCFPSTVLMAKISNLTYNTESFFEIMEMIWKRLNDHGKNWRHIYKALILLEYLVKAGIERVSQQCKKNIYAIETLCEFIYFEKGKNRGILVREKAKQLVNLLRDKKKLENERAKALKAKAAYLKNLVRFDVDGPSNSDMFLELADDFDLQIAIALSRTEHLQLTLNQSGRRLKNLQTDISLTAARISSPPRRLKKLQTVRQSKKEEPEKLLIDFYDISSSPPITPGRTADNFLDPGCSTFTSWVDFSEPMTGRCHNTFHQSTQLRSIDSGFPIENCSQSNDSAVKRTTNIDNTHC